MTEMRVGVRELKSRLSEYLQQVKSGQTITVTERGKPIGQVIPIKPSLEERVLALVEAGLLQWNGKKLEPRRPAAQNRKKKQVSELVVEDRDVDYLP
jgi:prevent-host-death family protein